MPWPACLAACSHLVIFRGGDEEEDGGDGVETFEPALPLRPLPSHVHHLEGNALDLKVILVDALGGFTSQQDVLLSGKIVLEKRRENTVKEYLHVERMNQKMKAGVELLDEEETNQQNIFELKVWSLFGTELLGQ